MFSFEPKIHDLAITAMRRHKDRLYRLWTFARALNEPHGSGIVALDDIQAQATKRSYKGFSPGTLRRLIREGEGVFWRTFRKDGRRFLELRGLYQVCQALGVRKLKRSPVYLKPRHLKTTLAFRAACYAARFAGDEFSNPISRKTLKRITGRSGNAQLRYERAMGKRIDKRYNAAMGGSWNNGDEVPEGHFVALVGGETVTLRRLPNSYRAQFDIAPRGIIRNVNRRLSGGNRLRPSGGRPQSQDRLFYDETKAAQRRAQALDECDRFYLQDDTRQWKREDCPTVMYSQWMVADRRLFCS